MAGMRWRFILAVTLLPVCCTAVSAGAVRFNFETIIPPGASSSTAFAINNLGQIVGTADGTAFLDTKGVFTSFNAPATPLDPVAINDAGQILFNGDPNVNYLFNQGMFTPLKFAELFPGILYIARSMNDATQIVGYYTGNNTDTGFLYQDGITTTLSVPGAFSTVAQDVSNTGAVVGFYAATQQAAGSQGFLYRNGTYTTVDFPGAISTTLLGINSSGEIIGDYVDATGSHNFIEVNGVFTSFNVPASRFTALFDVNDSGQIVGTYGKNTQQLGFLATPTEPDTLGVMLFGLAAVGFAVRTRHARGTGGCASNARPVTPRLAGPSSAM